MDCLEFTGKSSKVQSSITGLAKSRSLSNSSLERASFSLEATNSISIDLPIRIELIPLTPSLEAADFVASPAGSKTEGRSLIRTLARNFSTLLGIMKKY